MNINGNGVHSTNDRPLFVYVWGIGLVNCYFHSFGTDLLPPLNLSIQTQLWESESKHFFSWSFFFLRKYAEQSYVVQPGIDAESFSITIF